MAARPALFRDSELTRCAKAMQKSGVKDWSYVVRPDGSHEIVVHRTDATLIGPDPDEMLR